MLTAAGNINHPYSVIGLITASVIKPQKTGCTGGEGLPVDAAYQEAVAKLVDAGRRAQADGVIHIGFEHRVSVSGTGCNNSSNPNFELYAWGTLIKFPPGA